MEMNLLWMFAVLVLLFVIGLAALTRQRNASRVRVRTQARSDVRPSQLPPEPADAGLERPRRAEIQPLAPHEAQRFRLDWQALQARFAHSPRAAIAEADLLARDVMMRCGYPVTGEEAPSAHAPMEYAKLAANYRAAHDIAVRDRREQVDGDSLRLALFHYRGLFEQLLDTRAAAQPRATVAREPRRAGAMPRPEHAMARSDAAPRDRERRRER